VTRRVAASAAGSKQPMTVRAPRLVLALSMLCALTAGCSSADSKGSAKSITLYTCASANVEQAVIKSFQAANSGTTVNVFRAPTGQLNARVAADQRSGGIRADVIWGCDPLTMYGYDKQGLLRAWSPPNASEIPSAYRTPHFTGIDLLYMVLVVHKGAQQPATWAQLNTPAFRDKLALPSPSFAASALGMLGYFTSANGYGIDYYQGLKHNGAVQVNAPADTLTGVERGTYQVGATLANAAYADQKKGSPIEVVWPKPGGIAIPAPIGLTAKKHPAALAAQFAAYAASRAGQKLMAREGTYVTIDGLGGPPIPAGSPIVSPDWAALADHYQTLLADYVAIFGS
jgi:iron(III) transport system substrate-binding protein